MGSFPGANIAPVVSLKDFKIMVINSMKVLKDGL